MDWLVWRDDEPRSAALNMALDEALLGVAAQTGCAGLRIYRWANPAVSFGYFDRLEAVRTRFPGLEPVRRWTGGGAVEHMADVTFAVAAPRAHPLGQMSALDSYRSIHRLLADLLRQLGLDARLAVGGDAAPRSGVVAPCFVAPVCADVLLGSEKVAGGAQRRTRLGLLHQGSLQGAAMTQSFGESLRTLLAATGECLPAAFITATETSAATIARDRYAQPEWLARW